ncbi:hypothetical protein GCM10025867_50780 (plasmid) [Frondihabitans sucicola]|uniref:Uncharacterized protein n=1 Tax=Frondihabitans sucicola TaxID=1268041 RepID=A0ABN6Y663_9MICO|nr:hypothetical protein [Frondihabitans sucicola]BDZ52837.1 hypothetical protein GCM10025867_50780 [Frondihabitans sucicola]
MSAAASPAFASEVWKIVDSRTGRRATSGSFLSEEQCWVQITQWQDRHDRGGRPDVTFDQLTHMKPVLDDPNEPRDAAMNDWRVIDERSGLAVKVRAPDHIEPDFLDALAHWQERFYAERVPSWSPADLDTNGTENQGEAA